MQRDETYQQDDRTYCLRHPQIESNLRCGRCGDLICPRCMVTSPVGARCPSCARIGRPKALDTSVTEFGRAVLAGVIAAIAGAAVLGFVLWPLPIPLLGLAGVAGIGFLVGEAVRIGSGNKLDPKLKYVAGSCAFAGWAATAVLMPAFGNSPLVVANFYGIIGMIVAVSIAMYRVRVP